MSRNEPRVPLIKSARERLHAEIHSERTQRILEEGSEGCARVAEAIRDKARQLAENEQVQRTLESGKVFLNESGQLISQGVKSGAKKMMENEKIAAALTQAEEKIESFQEDERVQKGVSRLMDTCGRAAARIRKLFDR